MEPQQQQQQQQDGRFIRSYSKQIPKWQRYQTTLGINNNASTTGTNNGSNFGRTGRQQLQDPPHPYLRQYSHIYHQRLVLLGPKCWESIAHDPSIQLVGATNKSTTQETNTKDSSSSSVVLRVERILELKENRYCVTVGTLVKESSLEGNGGDKIHPSSECRTNDQLYLEDESGRVSIEFRTDNNNNNNQSDNDVYSQHSFCSGIVVGMMGLVGTDGIFTVEKVYYPNLVPLSSSVPDTVNYATSSASPQYLLLLSGLECGSANYSSLSRDMLLSFLQGVFPSARQKASLISHIICAGGLLAPPSSQDNNNTTSSSSISSTVYGCRELDAFCYEVTSCSGIPVTMVPGQNDPTTANWPQRPIHRSLLPTSLAKNNQLLSVVPNPYAASFQVEIASYNNNDDNPTEKSNNVRTTFVVGTDGRNIQDLVKRILVPSIIDKETKNDPENVEMVDNNKDEQVSQKKAVLSYVPISEIEALERTVRWGHICPTGPSSVPTVPHGPDNPDPMVFRDIPNIYFAGNCTQFATKLIANGKTLSSSPASQHKTRLVCIPSFAQTGEAVLVNLQSLQVELLRFEE